MKGPAFLFDLDGTLVDNAVVIMRDQVAHAKPDPDPFLAAAARRARALGVVPLSGGYGQDESQAAGAYRVYADPADLLRHLDEIGVRGAV